MTVSSSPPRRSTLLIIMDGMGLNPSRLDNAVALARTPNLDELYSSNPVTVLEASGAAVGLPAGQMGNSEVGHLTIGCGSILRQDLVVINESIANGEFAGNEAIAGACRSAAANKRPVHLIGLVSDGGVHSHLDHLMALIAACKQYKVKPMLHMITDGRDTAPKCATVYLSQIEAALKEANGQIATVSGRYYAMDRDNRWERVQLAFDAMVHGKGEAGSNAKAVIEAAWESDKTDEFILPAIIDGAELIGTGDQAIFFNFRNDRPRELSSALIQDAFDSFDRGTFSPIDLTTMTRYHPDFNCPVAFIKDKPDSTLGHVTFFFNGGREQPYDGEQRGLIASPKVDTYDLQPEMSAYEVRDKVLEAIKSDQFGFVVVNLANGDMVGHTGVRDAVIKAVEVVDEIVGELVQAATDNDFSVLLTADHGNADMLVDPVTGAPHTQHTIFPVACMVKDKNAWHLANGLGLSSGKSMLLGEKNY